MELSYINNPKSLFRKYTDLVTTFANSKRGGNFLSQKGFFNPSGEVKLLLPNGYHEQVGKNTYRLKVTTRPIFSNLLLPSLIKLDLAKERFPDLGKKDLLDMLYIDLGLKDFSLQYPRVYLTNATFNPDADTESTTVDGRATRVQNNETWATIRAGAGTISGDSEATVAPYISTDGIANRFDVITRAFVLFDTSSLPDTANILDTSKVQLYGTGVVQTLAGQSMALCDSNPQSNTAIVNSDYNIARWADTRYCDSDIAISSWNTSGYNDFVLNTAGLAAVSKTGITKMGSRLAADLDDSSPDNSAGTERDANATFNCADNGSNEPILSIDYSVGNFFLMF